MVYEKCITAFAFLLLVINMQTLILSHTVLAAFSKYASISFKQDFEYNRHTQIFPSNNALLYLVGRCIIHVIFTVCK